MGNKIMEQSILTANQRKLLDAAASADFVKKQFFLTGGTALSEFYFRHRLSEDLDFFSPESYEETQLLAWVSSTKKIVGADLVEQKQLRGQTTFFFHFSDEQVKVDFGFFPFEHIGNFYYYKKLRVSSVEDIATNKIQAVMTRKRARDFFDLFQVFEETELTLEKLLENYRIKFGVVLSKIELSKALAGVVDASDLPRFLGQVEWNSVEKYFVDCSKKLLV